MFTENALTASMPEAASVITTRRLIVTAARQSEVRDTHLARPGDGEVLVRVTECGMCGSDVTMFGGQHPVLRPPLNIGHEAIGRIAEINGSADGLRIGQPVAI